MLYDQFPVIRKPSAEPIALQAVCRMVSRTKQRQVSWLKSMTCCSAFPGFLLRPVAYRNGTLYHSDGIARDFHLLPYSPRFYRGTVCFILFMICSAESL